MLDQDYPTIWGEGIAGKMGCIGLVERNLNNVLKEHPQNAHPFLTYTIWICKTGIRTHKTESGVEMIEISVGQMNTDYRYPSNGAQLPQCLYICAVMLGA